MLKQKKNLFLIGTQIVIILVVIPLIVYRGLFYFRPMPKADNFQVSKALIEHMQSLQQTKQELEKEANLFKGSETSDAEKQYLQRIAETDSIDEILSDLEKVYQKEKKLMGQQLLVARAAHRRTYYDFALFIGTIWILISAFIQVAFLRMSINVFGLASVLIGVVGILAYIQETPKLSMWLLMLFFTILAIAFLVTGYQIATIRRGKK